MGRSIEEPGNKKCGSGKRPSHFMNAIGVDIHHMFLSCQNLARLEMIHSECVSSECFFCLRKFHEVSHASFDRENTIKHQPIRLVARTQRLLDPRQLTEDAC